MLAKYGLCGESLPSKLQEELACDTVESLSTLQVCDGLSGISNRQSVPQATPCVSPGDPLLPCVSV